MGNLQQLRMQSLFGGYDQLTPGAGGGGNMGYSDNYSLGSEPEVQPPPGLEQIGAQSGGGYSLGSEPEVQSPIQTPTIDPIAAPGATPTPPSQTFEDYVQMMNKGYTPATTARDRYDQLLNEAPQRQSPSWARAITAAALSVKAQDPIATADKVNYSPYYRQQADWKEKAEPFYKAAELENRANINERTLMGNAATAYSAAERNRITEERNLATAENQRKTNEIRYAIANGWENITAPHDTTYKLRNKATGTVRDSGVKTGSMMELDSINTKGQWAEKAADARAATAVAIANTQAGTTYEEVQADGSKKYFVIGRDGIRRAVREEGAAPTAGPGTTVPITAPGTPPGRPVAAAPTGGKPVVVPKSSTFGKVDGDSGTTKALTPLEQRMETNNKIAGILSRHPDWNSFINYNSDTELYEGMGAPPQPPKRGLFGMGSGSDEEWTRYKDDMDGYNYLRSLLHPGMAPYPTVGGSNAEQKAQRAQEAAKASPPGTSNKISSPESTRGIGPSGSTSAAPSGSGSATIGPSTTPNDPKSLPGGGSSTTSTDKNGTWMPPTGKYAFLPDYMNKPTPPNSSKVAPTAPPKAPPTPLPTGEPDNGPDAIPGDLLPKFQATIPRGSKVDAQGNTFRYTDPKGNVRYWSRELDRWVDYDPTSGPRRR